jgi:hypothetical protein
MRRENDILDDDEPDRLSPDPFLGLRKHCWVMIKKGARGLNENLFIEPSTGRCWNIQEKKYPFLKCS